MNKNEMKVLRNNLLETAGTISTLVYCLEKTAKKCGEKIDADLKLEMENVIHSAKQVQGFTYRNARALMKEAG